jgi:hypothetical protein
MPIIDIPIAFEWEGIYFEGVFSTSKGNENVFHLKLFGYHYGQLVNYCTGWKWCPNINGYFTEDFMERFFIETVEAYLKQAKDP